MEARLEKLNHLLDKYKDRTEGQFLNCLWQLLVNDARDLASLKSCFVYVRHGDHQIRNSRQRSERLHAGDL